MGQNVRVLAPEEYARWNEAVFTSPCGTLFQTTYWLEASGVPFQILGVWDTDHLLGGFVAPYRLMRGFGRVSDRPALTPYTGLVAFHLSGRRSTAITEFKHIAAATADALRQQFVGVNVRLSPAVQDLQPFLWAGYGAAVRYTYRVDLSDWEAAWRNLDENHRRNIRKGEKEGLHITLDLCSMDCLDLFRATREQPAAWAPLIQRYDAALRKHGTGQTIGICDRDGRLVACALIVWDHLRSYYLLGGFQEGIEDPAIRRAAASMAIWEAMGFTKETLGLKEFDLEGSMIPGVELFFRKFGGALVPYYTITWQTRRLAAYRHCVRASGSIGHSLGLVRGRRDE